MSGAKKSNPPYYYFHPWIGRLCLCLALLFTGQTAAHAQTSILKTDSGYVLLRNGQPYYVKGVGGSVNLPLAVAIGANSIRTWGIEDAERILDEAHRLGLSVMLGFWLQHERHGFDYNDTVKVNRQYRHFCAAIDRFKNHPALLIWGIGNELDLQYSNPRCWDAVQQIAAYAHKVDPNHPTSTVTAGLDSMEVVHIRNRAPDIDLLGINTYGDIKGVPANIRRFGWHGPYMITEWGPNGYWESPVTPWKAAIEQSSTEKKQVYLERYDRYIGPEKAQCVGSYAFLWGAKQEYTETWFGLFSKDNLPTEPIDALEYVFTGSWPSKPAPSVNGIQFDCQQRIHPQHFLAGDAFTAVVKTDSLEKKNPGYRYHWRILAESTDKKSGGDAELAAAEIRGTVRNPTRKSIQGRMPMNPGAYRLFLQVTANGKVAYQNLPFMVIERKPEDGQARWMEFKKQGMEDRDE
jgi:hypothetical protein